VFNYTIKNFNRKFSKFLGEGWFRTAERWVAGPSSYPLGYEVVVEMIILGLPDELQGRGILQNYGVELS